MGFRVWGLGLRVWVWGLGSGHSPKSEAVLKLSPPFESLTEVTRFRIEGLGFRLEGLVLRI